MIRSPFLAVSMVLVAAPVIFGIEFLTKRPDGRDIATSEIDATVTRLMEAAHVTGAGVAVFHEGKIAYLKAYGYRDTEKRLPLTPNSVMTAASLSKSAFAAVVMRLVQDRVLDLDKPIHEYLPKPLPE
jgi:CubicO group peptidase (beta-lactamase class C family)